MEVYFIDIENWNVPTQSAEFIGWEMFILDATDFEINFYPEKVESTLHPSYLNIILF